MTKILDIPYPTTVREQSGSFLSRKLQPIRDQLTERGIPFADHGDRLHLARHEGSLTVCYDDVEHEYKGIACVAINTVDPSDRFEEMLTTHCEETPEAMLSWIETNWNALPDLYEEWHEPEPIDY